MVENYDKGDIDNFHSQINETLKEISKKLDITNGRVTSLEKWQSFIMGGLAVLTIVIPILIWALTKDVESRVHKTIQQELSRYEIVE